MENKHRCRRSKFTAFKNFSPFGSSVRKFSRIVRRSEVFFWVRKVRFAGKVKAAEAVSPEK
jgi:hypothetical protein